MDNSSFLEMFNLDPIENLEYFPEKYLYDRYDELSEYLIEASAGTTIKNVFQKIWEIIKKVCKTVYLIVASILKSLAMLYLKDARV